ncbi:tetratricopeptide repeat protein [Dysgonomonas macrotermitis]|nr:tetratricopeptide repeat protein [Dysgonomonas macrotermitis]
MKPIITFIFIITAIFGLKAETVSEQAINAYQDGNFRKAIELLEGEIKVQKEQGKVSPELYYNLGNAYFRVNEIPEALLNYERALLYNPGDRDTRHNIEYAQTKIEDKILTADNFFLQIWFDGIQNQTTANNWAKWAILFFVLFIAALFVFFFSPKLNLKKVGFYSAIVCLVVVIFTNIFAYRQKSRIENRNTAIIMAGSAPVASAPNTTSKELFILHAGTKVVINKVDGSWYEIEIANGSIGWIQKDKLEII